MNECKILQGTGETCGNMHYGYSYVLNQKFANLYAISDALCNGTLFKELNLPITVYGKQVN